MLAMGSSVYPVKGSQKALYVFMNTETVIPIVGGTGKYIGAQVGLVVLCMASVPLCMMNDLNVYAARNGWFSVGIVPIRR